MAEYNAIIRIRRGLDSERRITLLESGEIAYSTDTKRAFIGDGVNLGGTVIGNKNFIGNSPDAYAIQNDLFFNPTTLQAYILSSSSGGDNIESYAKITPSVDGTTLKSENGVFSVNFESFDDPYNGYLKLSGGILNGFITLHAQPELEFHAANKGYVDDALSNISISNFPELYTKFVDVSGDTMTGPLTILSSLNVTKDVTFNGELNVLGDTSINGDLNLNDSKLLRFRPEIKNITLTQAQSTYTLLDSDNGSILILSAGLANCKVYCPEDLSIGYNIKVIKISDDDIYILPTPVSLAQTININNYYIIKKKYGVCDIIVINTNTFLLNGDLF